MEHQTGVGSRRKYMSKAQRACDGCRSRKSACQIDVAPPCRLCRAYGQPCEFTSRVRRKKSPLAVGGSHRTGHLNDAPSHLPQERPSFPNLAQCHLTENQHHPQPSSVRNSVPPLDIRTTLDASFVGEPLGNSEYPSPQPDSAMFDDLLLSMYGTYQPSLLLPNLEGAPRSLDNLPDVTAQLCGLTGDMDPYVLQHYKFDANSEFAFSKLTIRRVQESAVPVQFLLSKQELAAESQAEAELHQHLEPIDLSAVVPPEIGGRLIRLFFRFIQPQFPLLYEDSPPNPGSTPTHLLAAIYCIAQPFAPFDDCLCVELAYTPLSAQALLNMAWRSLNQSLSQPTISSVQAAIILLLRQPTNQLVLDSAWKWTLLGMTVSMAQTLGLHLDPHTWNLPESETVLRRRLSWLIYTVDKWLAFSFGRPSHISKDDWLVTEISESDLQRKEQAVPSFPREFSNLTSILDTILGNLYSIRASATLSHDFRLTFETARPLLNELAEWAQKAPNATSSDTLTSCDGVAQLHISYHSLKILILRALLRPFNHPECEISPEDKPEWDAAKSHIRQAARAEAETALNRISILGPANYQAFWAPWHKTSFALVTHLIFLLAVSAYLEIPDASNDKSSFEGGSEANADYVAFRRLLDQARQVFRLHAKSLDIIKFSLLRIDAIYWMGWEKVLGFD
ncbi:fungal-specific transcription factor domain-containing protein [Aspergillus similis]